MNEEIRNRKKYVYRVCTVNKLQKWRSYLFFSFDVNGRFSIISSIIDRRMWSLIIGWPLVVIFLCLICLPNGYIDRLFSLLQAILQFSKYLNRLAFIAFIAYAEASPLMAVQRAKQSAASLSSKESKIEASTGSPSVWGTLTLASTHQAYMSVHVCVIRLVGERGMKQNKITSVSIPYHTIYHLLLFYQGIIRKHVP